MPDKTDLIKNENFYVTHGWMRKELGLKGNELDIYAIIYGFSQTENQFFTGTHQYLAQWLGVSRQTVITCLNSLIKKGMIVKKEEIVNGVKLCKYRSKILIGYQKTLQGCQVSLQDGVKNFDRGCQNFNSDTSNNNIGYSIDLPTPTSPTPSIDLADVEKNSDRELMFLTSEQMPELQARLREMTDFENLEGDFKRFTAATIGRLAEIISTGRVSKGKTVYPSELIKQLDTISEKEKSLIPFMSRLRAKCDKALSRLEDGTSCENYLRTVIVDFLLRYVPASQAEQKPAEETDPFSDEVYTEILEAYNSICKSLPKVMMMSDKRRKAVAAKLQEGYTVDQIKSAFELAEASPFLRGEVSTFKADFDWIFLEDHLLKILENKYEERKPAQSPSSDDEPDLSEYSEAFLRSMGLTQ